MQTIKLPKSLRKFVRSEKARIRRGVLDLQQQTELIGGLYKKIFETHEKKQQKPMNKQDNIISAAAEKVLQMKQ